MSRNILLQCSVSLMPCQGWLQQPTIIWRDLNTALGRTKAFPDPRSYLEILNWFLIHSLNFFCVLPYNFLCISVGNYTRGRFQWPRGLRRGSAAACLLRLWVRIPPGHGRLSSVSFVRCQVEVTASCWSLVQRSHTECGVSEYEHESSIMRRSWTTWVKLETERGSTWSHCVENRFWKRLWAWCKTDYRRMIWNIHNNIWVTTGAKIKKNILGLSKFCFVYQLRRAIFR
jgi:hypothetical protein